MKTGNKRVPRFSCRGVHPCCIFSYKVRQEPKDSVLLLEQMTENKNLYCLREAQDAFHNRINEVAQNAGLLLNGVQPIYDGVYDVEAYKKSSPRIMWILKEAWEKHEEGEDCGGWALYDPIGKVGETWSKETKSWRFMNLVGYGIVNDKDWTYLEKHDRMDGVTMTNVQKILVV